MEFKKIKRNKVNNNRNNFNCFGYVDILDEKSFKNELKNQFKDQELDIVVNGDGSFIITVKDTNRKYYVNDDKTVINSDNIIEINNEEELKAFRDDVNNGNSYEGKAVLLTNDIDLQGEEWEPIGYYDQTTDEKNPDTEINKPFKGIFDGGNYEINGLKITSTKNGQGLFGFSINGDIRNVVLGKDNNISGKDQTGGIVGYLYGTKGNISNCINYGNITGNASAGGIVGRLSGQHTIYNCKNYGDITGSGGIVGRSNGTNWEEFTNYSNQIINCGNYGNVTKIPFNDTDTYYCGGIAGFLKGNILNCLNKGTINGSEHETGGIAGSTSNGKIENCYNLQNVSGTSGIGGIVGGGGDPPGICIYNCYTKGEISGSGKYFGEIIGWLSENAMLKEQKNCYTKDDTFTASDLGDAFVDNPENPNQPLLYWEEI